MASRYSLIATLSCMGLTAALFAAPALPDSAPNTHGVLDGLIEQSGVWHKSSGGTMPNFFIDPAWPALLPHNWVLGQIGGLYVDSHDPVSYTHLDVYKRQILPNLSAFSPSTLGFI